MSLLSWVSRSDRPGYFHRAMGCAGRCFHIHIFRFKIHLYPELLLIHGSFGSWISDGFKSCCHLSGLFLWSSQGAPHTVLCFEERYRQANASCIPPGWVGTAPRAPSSPLVPWLLTPPTVTAVTLSEAHTRHLQAAATLLRPGFCRIYVFMTHSPELLINPKCRGCGRQAITCGGLPASAPQLLSPTAQPGRYWVTWLKACGRAAAKLSPVLSSL